MKFITALPIAALPNERVRRARLHGELHLQRPPSERTSTGHWLASLWRPYRCTPTNIFPNIDIPVLSHSPALQARGLSPLDVVYAVNAQNLILSGGTAKIGSLELQHQPQRQHGHCASSQRSAGEHFRRSRDLPPRCGARTWRLCAANQHRAHQRHALGPAAARADESAAQQLVVSAAEGYSLTKSDRTLNKEFQPVR